MKKIIIGLVIVVIGGLAIVGYNSSHKEQKQTKQLQKASIRFSWIPSAVYAGDIAGLTKFDEENGLELTAEYGGLGINTTQMVATGQNTFGSIGADEVLAANDKGADFVIIGVLNYRSPAAYVSAVDKNIKTPKDLEGKKVGVLPFGDTTLIYENMLKVNNVDRSKITEITISGELKPLISGEYDVQPVYAYDETVTLDQEGFKYNMIEPKDFGITNTKGIVYFTNRETLEKNPELVKAFVKTVADGWNYALGHQDEAISMMKAYTPEIDEVREKMVLQKGAPYYRQYQDQPMNSDLESWPEMIRQLKEAGTIQNDVDLNKVLHLEFIHDYYKNRK